MQNARLDETQAEMKHKPQICRWHHPYYRKWRRTKKPLDEGERGKWKSWLKTQYSKNEDHGIGPITSWQIDGETMEKVQFSSVTQLCPTLSDPMDCSTPGSPVHHQLPELAQTYIHWVGDAIQPSYLLSPPSPAFNLIQLQGLFQWVSSLHQVASVEVFIFSISSFNEYSGMISFRMDWLDLFAVQGTLKSLLQHHSSKASILWCSALASMKTVTDFIFLGSKITADGDGSHELKDACFLEEKLWQI